MKHGSACFVGKTDIIEADGFLKAGHGHGIGSVLHVRFDVQDIKYPSQPHGHILGRHPVSQQLSQVVARFPELVSCPAETGQIPDNEADPHKGNQISGKGRTLQIRPPCHQELSGHHEGCRHGEHDDRDQGDEDSHAIGCVEGNDGIFFHAPFGVLRRAKCLDQADGAKGFLNGGGDGRCGSPVDERAGAHARHGPVRPYERGHHKQSGNKTDPGAEQGYETHGDEVGDQSQQNPKKVANDSRHHSAILIDAENGVARTMPAMVVQG